jgi:hypothetical protein
MREFAPPADLVDQLEAWTTEARVLAARSFLPPSTAFAASMLSAECSGPGTA